RDQVCDKHGQIRCGRVPGQLVQVGADPLGRDKTWVAKCRVGSAARCKRCHRGFVALPGYDEFFGLHYMNQSNEHEGANKRLDKPSTLLRGEQSIQPSSWQCQSVGTHCG